MSAAELILVIAWVVLGIGGGYVAGDGIGHRDWPVAIGGLIAMAIGIACGVAAW